jgi:spore maturation protein CgeB
MKKILVIDTVYHQALMDYKKSIHNIQDDDYDSAASKFFGSRFGTSDVYSYQLSKLGFESHTLIVNSHYLQNLWTKKYLGESSKGSFSDLINYATRLPILGEYFENYSIFHKILESQVDFYKPDILYFQDLNFVNQNLLSRFRKKGIYLIGQIASPLPDVLKLKCYDHIYSSLPNLVEKISSLGVESSYLPIGFDERVLHEIDLPKKNVPISFVGGISSIHSSTIPLLEAIFNEHEDLALYGYGKNQIKMNKNLKSMHRGNAWGLDMYKIIASSLITLNRHSNISEKYANNMRLFEATGVGTLLLTDYKSNLEEYFKIDEEVLTYNNPGDAIEKIAWALRNPEQAKRISIEGQKRTLKFHTYEKILSTVASQINQKV